MIRRAGSCFVALTTAIILLAALPAGANLPGDEGCTPGYWKNHEDSWAVTGYSPSRTVLSVWSGASAFPNLADDSLMDALNYEGGSGLEGAARNLLRQSVAALLNTNHPDVDFPAADGVINRTNEALTSGSRAAMLTLKDLFDAKNNLGCPLN